MAALDRGARAGGVAALVSRVRGQLADGEDEHAFGDWRHGLVTPAGQSVYQVIIGQVMLATGPPIGLEHGAWWRW
jgi:hypothetical protein